MLSMPFRVSPRCAAAFAVPRAVPTPKEHFGYEPGDDYKLASYDEVIGYFQKLAAARTASG
jgi:hypothetical protein